MAILAITVGIFVFSLSGGLIGELTHNASAGILPGLVLAILAAYPIFKYACEKRSNLLHPEPREYQISPKIAFAKIRDILAEQSYNYGDKWHVVTADTQTGKITANLRFRDEHNRIETDTRGNIYTRKDYLQRFLVLDIQVLGTEHGTTLVELNFAARVEGVNYGACDWIISSVSRRLESALESSSVAH